MILPAFDIQGHRGALGLRPENTLPSFEAALDGGATSLETDVHLTADGMPVLCHDPRLHGGLYRRADGSDMTTNPAVHKLRLAQLAEFTADRNPDPACFPDQTPAITPLADWFTCERGGAYMIPTLADLFRFVSAYADEPGRQVGKLDGQRASAARIIIDIEIKRVPFRDPVPSGPIEREVLAAIRTEWRADRARVRSFDHRCVRRLRDAEPGLTGVVLVEGTAPVDPVAVARAAGAQVYAPDVEYLDEEQVRRCYAAGIAVIPWTVNDAKDWETLVAWGVDGITTDYPDRLAAWLGARSA
jgi:glycerophosphoryl diester phosphodiesterase